MWLGLTPAQPTGVSLYVRSGSTALNDTYVVLGDGNTTTNNGAIFFYANQNGNLVVRTAGRFFVLGPYTADTWYNVLFTVDWACDAFDVTINGQMKQFNLPFRDPGVSEFSELHVFNYDSSTAWWDQIAFSGPPAGMEIFSDGFERASSCRWSSESP